MGRSADHLALGIGKAAGATLTVIAEEFRRDEPLRLSRLVDVIETSMLKRIAHGRPFGVAVLAEGLGLRLPQDELARAMPEIELDEHGHGVELVPGGPRVHDPAGPRGPRGSGQAPPDRSGRAHARGLPRPVRLPRRRLSPCAHVTGSKS